MKFNKKSDKLKLVNEMIREITENVSEMRGCPPRAASRGENMNSFQIITNNPSLEGELSHRYPEAPIDVSYRKLSFRSVLTAVRDEIHGGAKLLSHPLSGSVKPLETPYKSVLIERRDGADLDLDSLSLIENAIQACDKFKEQDRIHIPELQKDFQLVDRSLILTAVDSLLSDF